MRDNYGELFEEREINMYITTNEEEECFRSFDVNGSGFVEEDELFEFMKQLMLSEWINDYRNFYKQSVAQQRFYLSI